jgi:hypothetical protein
LGIDGDEWSGSEFGRFSPGKVLSIPLEQDNEWSSKQVWTLWRIEKLLISAIICKNPPDHNLVLYRSLKAAIKLFSPSNATTS